MFFMLTFRNPYKQLVNPPRLEPSPLAKSIEFRNVFYYKSSGLDFHDFIASTCGVFKVMPKSKLEMFTYTEPKDSLYNYIQSTCKLSMRLVFISDTYHSIFEITEFFPLNSLHLNIILTSLFGLPLSLCLYKEDILILPCSVSSSPPGASGYNSTGTSSRIASLDNSGKSVGIKVRSSFNGGDS